MLIGLLEIEHEVMLPSVDLDLDHSWNPALSDELCPHDERQC